MIKFRKIWSDESIIELDIIAETQFNRCYTKIYVGKMELEQLHTDLQEFAPKIYGGVYDMNFGKFGPEYAKGAISARFHFQPKGHINITYRSQSEYYTFGKREIANEFLLHLTTEPSLLDKFIKDIPKLLMEDRVDIQLDCLINTCD